VTKPAWKPEVREESGFYFVQSETAPGVSYAVDLRIPTCNCPHFGYRQRPCKHIAAAREFAESAIQLQRQCSAREVGSPPVTPEQEQLLNALLIGADRLSALVPKAETLGCKLLTADLLNIAKLLRDAVGNQRRAFSGQTLTPNDPDDPFVIQLGG
jgi:hypothetical protein